MNPSSVIASRVAFLPGVSMLITLALYFSPLKPFRLSVRQSLHSSVNKDCVVLIRTTPAYFSKILVSIAWESDCNDEPHPEEVLLEKELNSSPQKKGANPSR